MYKKIIVATDGSSLSERGVDCAIDFAKSVNAELFIVTVTNPIPGYGANVSTEWIATASTLEEYSKEMNAGAKKILDQAKSKAIAAGLTEIHVVHAEHQLPSHGIIDAAKEYNADLIILASHGRRGIKRVILGSQAQEVLSLSEIPVLIIK